MLIDRSHRSWAIGSAAALAVSAAAYIPYAASSDGPSGGSAMGLTYGVAGFAAMAFAGLLSVRKKFPIWRIGRAQTWMRGHLWLGALSFPLICFHAGFAAGGPLTRALMWLFAIVFVSGVAGAALQHVLPRLMLERVPMETIYEQIPHVRLQLVDEADAIVAAVAAEGTALADFYARDMRPFVERPDARHWLADARQAQGRFAQLRTVLPAALHPVVDDLASLCEEERQLSRQLRLHRLLHGWLLVHVPLSFALLLLSVVHIVMAVRY